MDAGGDRLSFLGKRLPPELDVREVAVSPGARCAFDSVDWEDALVVVEQGEIELECRDGGRCRFGRGDVLWLVGLPVHAIRNPGRTAALLTAISRRRGRAVGTSGLALVVGAPDRHEP
jgi:quercetin dioxygenase-like cupin family protein